MLLSTECKILCFLAPEQVDCCWLLSKVFVWCFFVLIGYILGLANLFVSLPMCSFVCYVQAFDLIKCVMVSFIFLPCCLLLPWQQILGLN